MALSPVALKGLIGVGTVSTIVVGGTLLYNNWDSFYNEIENLVLSTEGTWTWGVKTETSNDSSKHIEVKGTLAGQNGSKSKIWTCKIKEKVEGTSKTLNIDSQVTELKTALGINGDANQTRSKNKNHNFKQFFEKCKEGKLTVSTPESAERVIEIETENDSGNNRRFKTSDFKVLYDGSEEIIKELGIETKTLEKEHTLTEKQMEKIKFEGKTSLKITDVSDLKLKIEKTDETSVFPEGLKFTFKTGKDVSQIGIKANTNTEFKIKITDEGVYSLERAWTKETLADKVGLIKNGSDNKFTFKNETKVNIHRTTDNISCFGSTAADESKSFTIEEASGHNQGFKIIVENDISLKECNPRFSMDLNIKLDSKKSYSIGYRNANNFTGWYFIEEKSN